MKSTIITVIVLAIIAVLFYFGYQKMINKDSVDVSKDAPAVVMKEFGQFSDFVKGDLTDEQKMELKKILEEREMKVAEMKKILAEEFGKEEAERKMEVAYAKIAQMRDEIKAKILSFIDPEKTEEFEVYFNTLGAEIEAEYILK